jgi:intracellular sulfur oxidation DsrE/DsrF family protein
MQSRMVPDELTLNAYVDGELDTEQERRVLSAMECDPQVREQVCTLRRAKDWMRTGFVDAVPPRPPTAKIRMPFSPGYGLAASLVALALAFGGALVGYVCAERQATVVAQQQDSDHILLHLDESGSDRFAAVLDYAEKFLAEHAARGVEVEVVANAGGIDLMRADRSPFAQRVRALQQEYRNLHFIACANAIRNLRSEGEKVKMLDGVRSGESAVDHIVDRLQHGWRYVKVSDLPGI